jgi:hypothetical protein
MAANEMRESGGNGLPENRVNGVADTRDSPKSEESNQRYEQPVLEQILAFLFAPQSDVRQPYQRGNSNGRLH